MTLPRRDNRHLPCSVADCPRPAKKRGWCETHYRRWRKTGSPLIIRPHPIKHGFAGRLPGHRHPLYFTWLTMMSRCYNPKTSGYPRYGARGIRVCERWHTPEYFFADIGARPPGHSLDRINGNGDYEPKNVRWATMTTQSRNRRSNKLTADQVAAIRWRHRAGERQTDLARAFGVSAATMHAVVHRKIWR